MLSLRVARTSILRQTRSYATASPDALDTALRAALKAAMKGRDKAKSSLFKSVLAELQNASHLPSPPPPSKTLAKAISARQDGAKIYATSNPPRADLEELYNWEASVLSEFVPPEPAGMDPAKLDELVGNVLEELGLSKDGGLGKNVGRVIKAVNEKVAGGATGKQVAEAVRKIGATLS